MKNPINVGPPESGPICDFCSDPEVFASLPCEDFVADRLQAFGILWASESKGHWAACKTCDALIRDEDWEGLLDRSLDRLKATIGFVPTGTRGKIRELHKEFRRHRKREA